MRFGVNAPEKKNDDSKLLFWGVSLGVVGALLLITIGQGIKFLIKLIMRYWILVLVIIVIIIVLKKFFWKQKQHRITQDYDRDYEDLT